MNPSQTSVPEVDQTGSLLDSDFENLFDVLYDANELDKATSGTVPSGSGSLPHFPATSDSWFDLSTGSKPLVPLATGTSSGESDQAQLHQANGERQNSPNAVVREGRLAKKRLNQKHYREREKQQRQQANARLAELEAQLSKLSVENSRLKLKHGALEIFVYMLDQIVAALLSDEVVPRDRQTTEEWMASVKTAQSMTVADFREIWRVLITEAADLLLQVDSGNQEAMQQMESKSDAAERFLLQLEVISPALSDEITTINLETGDTEDPGPEFWLNMIRGVGLTDEQLDQIDEGIHTIAYSQLEGARKRLLEDVGRMADLGCHALDVIANSPSSTIHDVPHPNWGCNPTGTVAALQKMLQREGLIGALQSTYICSMVLTTRQKVALVVSTYPYLIHTRQALESIKLIKREREALRPYRR